MQQLARQLLQCQPGSVSAVPRCTQPAPQRPPSSETNLQPCCCHLPLGNGMRLEALQVSLQQSGMEPPSQHLFRQLQSAHSILLQGSPCDQVPTFLNPKHILGRKPCTRPCTTVHAPAGLWARLRLQCITRPGMQKMCPIVPCSCFLWRVEGWGLVPKGYLG